MLLMGRSDRSLAVFPITSAIAGIITVSGSFAAGMAASGSSAGFGAVLIR
jgi:hypothetical protein